MNELIALLIGDIYGAAVDPARWRDALNAMAGYVGGVRATLSIAADGPASSPAYFDSEEWTHRRGAGNCQPRVPSIATDNSDKVGTGPAAPQRGSASMPAAATATGVMPDNASVPPIIGQIALNRGAGGGATFTVYGYCRTRADSASAFKRMRLLAPHIWRAIEISRANSWKENIGSTLLHMLNGINAGVFLLNATGQHLYANVRGQTMLASKYPIHMTGDKLVVSLVPARAVLSAALNDNREVTVGLTEQVQPTRAAQVNFLARLLPLRADSVFRRSANGDAAAVLIVQETEWHNEAAEEEIARRYNLAPRERDTLQTIAEGGGVSDAAHRLNIASSTAKTYVQRLLEKTCTKRPTELIALCAAYRSPFWE